MLTSINIAEGSYSQPARGIRRRPLPQDEDLSLQLRDQDASIQSEELPAILSVYIYKMKKASPPFDCLIPLLEGTAALQKKAQATTTINISQREPRQLHLVLTSWAANGSSRDCAPSSLPAGLSSHPQELMWQHPQTPNSSSAIPCKNLSYLHTLPALRSSSASETFSYSISLQRNMLGQRSLLIFHCRIYLCLPEQNSTT